MIDYRVYIEGQLLDMFEDETVKITDSIKDAKDVGSIFTEYSQQISVPASRNNNAIFKNFYNYDIINGFDARKKRPAEIQLNGQTWKRGFIELMGVQLKEEKPQHYKIVFRGALSKLKDIVGDDKLSDLSELNQYSHEYNFANVKQGFETLSKVVNGNLQTATIGQGEDSICYPFISHTKRYVYNIDNVYSIDEENQITNTPLEFEQLKPALKMQRIIEAIEDRYDITFRNNPGEDFYNGSLFRDLYMLLHNDSGQMISGDLQQEIFNRDSYTLNSGDDNWDSDNGLETTNFPGNQNTNKVLTLEVDLIVGGTGLINYKVVDQFTQDVLFEEEEYQVTNGETISLGGLFEAPPNGTRFYQPVISFETEDLGITSLDVEVKTIITETATNPQTATIGNYSLTGGSINVTQNVIITDQIPSMKVIDFLTSTFKQFNLVGYVNNDDEIVVQTLDTFYDLGDVYDLTNHIDISKKTVNKLNPFSEIDFQFEKAGTFTTITRNRRLDDEFGNLNFSIAQSAPLQDQYFGGGKYDIKVGFEKILLERLIDPTDNIFTPYVFGWLVDKKQDPTLTKPYVFAPKKTFTIFEKPLSFETDGQNLNTYIRASNAVSVFNTLHFGSEIDEYYLYNIQNSLFEKFYKNYIQRVFNPQSRKVKISAYLPMWFILNYKLNDEVIINGRRFRINKLDVTLNDRSADIELINIPEQRERSILTSPVRTTYATNLEGNSITSNGFDIEWVGVGDFDDRVESYDVFIDNQLQVNKLITDTLAHSFTRLSSGTSYNVKVISKTADGVDSEDISNVTPNQAVNKDNQITDADFYNGQAKFLDTISTTSINLTFVPKSKKIHTYSVNYKQTTGNYTLFFGNNIANNSGPIDIDSNGNLISNNTSIEIFNIRLETINTNITKLSVSFIPEKINNGGVNVLFGLRGGNTATFNDVQIAEGISTPHLLPYQNTRLGDNEINITTL